jgi:hypothetical protein
MPRPSCGGWRADGGELRGAGENKKAPHISRHGRARPDHQKRHLVATDGRDKPGHDARRAANNAFIQGRSATDGALLAMTVAVR